MTMWQLGLIVASTAAAAINAGSFFAFSNFVMPALGRMPEGEGIRSMQEINLAAPNPAFVIAIMAPGPLGGIVAAARWSHLGESAHTVLLVAAALSLASTLITMTLNVPRNNALAAAESQSTAGQAVWADYLLTWTRANTARTVASLGSVLLFALSMP